MRRAKAAVFGLFMVAVFPLVAAAWLEKRISRSDQVFVFFAHLLALLPGLPGAYARGAYYFGTLDRCSWETNVGFGSLFTRRGGSVGRKASIGCYCVLGHADIGPGVMMGSRVSVPSGKRQHLDAAGCLSAHEGSFDRVSVGGGSWIGEGAIILADIGPRCIVSAGAVVNRPMPAGSLVAGNPAKILRMVASDSLAHVEN